MDTRKNSLSAEEIQWIDTYIDIYYARKVIETDQQVFSSLSGKIKFPRLYEVLQHDILQRLSIASFEVNQQLQSRHITLQRIENRQLYDGANQIGFLIRFRGYEKKRWLHSVRLKQRIEKKLQGLFLSQRKVSQRI